MPQKSDPYPCTPDDRFCVREESVHQLVCESPELVTKLGACGVTCSGRQAEDLKGMGLCGLPGAVNQHAADQNVYQQVARRSRVRFRSYDAEQAGIRAVKQIFELGVDPSEVL